MLRIREYIHAALTGIRSPDWKEEVRFDEARGEYTNTSVYRGFPLGSIGSGGFGIDTAGGFQDLRINNNWMRPIAHAKGSLWAAACKAPKGPRRTRILRRSYSGGREYYGIQPIEEVHFRGRVPTFTQRFDGDWPLHIEVLGFSPLVPHDAKDSSLPAASFRVALENTGDRPLETSFLFSWENVLGRGGTGQTGVRLWNTLPVRLKGKLRYDDVSGNYQSPLSLDGLQGLRFATTQEHPERSHRQSVLGEYLLLGAEAEGVEWSRCLSWDADDDSAPWRSFFAHGHLDPLDQEPPTDPPSHSRPAAALCAKTHLEPQARVTLDFILVWWTPSHVTEKDAYHNAARKQHKGVRVGHYYENHFESPEQVALYLHRDRDRLYAESTALHDLLEASDLPHWLKYALPNAADSVICNTVLPKDGTLHTIEGMGWHWFFGGLCGTNDQRLSSQPYTSTFFPELDKSEVDAFRQLMENGAIPHGIGNCDTALCDADVPYGWPVQLFGALAELDWPDLSLSSILQTLRLYRLTGDQAWLDESWPDLLLILDRLQESCRHGIPEGGSTYDTFSFPGTFIYSGTLMLAALDAVLALAPERSPDRVEELQRWRDEAAARIDEALWQEDEGFYRSAEAKATLFLGGLAGDWFARYMGLPPVLPPERVRSHLKAQHQALIVPRMKAHYTPAAYPHVEAYPHGEPVLTKLLGSFDVAGYAWQVISYHGCEAIYAGLVEEGLDGIRILYDHIWKGGWPWSADLWGNAGSVYMTHPVLWALPQALTGAALDLPEATLHLSPRPLPGRDEAAIPFFFPSFWAMLHSDGKECRLEVKRHFGEAIRLKTLRLSGVDGEITERQLEPAWEMAEGESYTFGLE